jgi:hypothetical protein
VLIFTKKFRRWFDLVWSLYAKVIKKRGKQKMENEPEQKKRKKRETDRTAQSSPTRLESAAAQQGNRNGIFIFFLSGRHAGPTCQHGLLPRVYLLTGNRRPNYSPLQSPSLSALIDA